MPYSSNQICKGYTNKQLVKKPVKSIQAEDKADLELCRKRQKEKNIPIEEVLKNIPR